MSSQKVYKFNCQRNTMPGVSRFLSLQEALSAYSKRLMPENSVNSHLFDLEALKALITMIDAYNSNPNLNDEEKIRSIRTWRTSSKWDVVCESEEESSHFIEDLVLSPVLANGDDFYGETTNNDDRTFPTCYPVTGPPVVKNVHLFLGSVRPCPEWCGVDRSSGDKSDEKDGYLSSRRDIPARPTGSELPTILSDPYEHICQ